MPAIVRVKRRVDEEPLGAFVLNGKKRRLEDGSAAAAELVDNDLSAVGVAKDDISTILKFAGTIVEQDDDVTTQFARLTKDKAKELVQQKTNRISNATEKVRQNVRQATHENRFKIVNCMRAALPVADEAAAGGSTEFTIVDIEKQQAVCAQNDKLISSSDETNSNIPNTTGTAVPATELTQPSDSDTGYVYDLYLPENEQQADYVDMMDDNYLSVRPFDDFFYEDRFNDDEDDLDSEDSNQENYFGNDYPDEEDDMENCYESDAEREACKAMEKFVFGDDEEEEEAAGYVESSDDEDFNQYQDPYVQTVDLADDDDEDDDEIFAYGVDLCDVQRYGTAYARYKKRVLNNLNSDESSQSDEELSGVGSVDDYHSAFEEENDEEP